MHRYLLGFMLALNAQSAVGQSPPSPAEVLAEAFRADSVNDWQRLLQLIHPKALADFKQQLVQDVGRGTFEPNANPDTCMARRESEFNHFLLDSVFRVRNFEALGRLPPDTLFARARRAYMPSTVGAEWHPTRQTILGSVSPNDSVAYVVVNEYLGRAKPPVDRPRVYVAELQGRNWRLLDTDFVGIPGSLGFEPKGVCPFPRDH